MTNGLEAAWDWQQLSQTKARELGEAYSILTKALQEQKMPSLDEVPRPVLETSAATGALGLLLLVLLIPNTRRALWNVVDTTLAVICLLLLLAVVIGMPFGAMYIGSRGLGFLASSLLHAFPQLGTLLASVQETFANLGR